MTIIEKLCEALNEAGFKASIWQGRRIYLNGFGRDIKAYFDYQDAGDENTPADECDDVLAHSRLRVFSNCNQSRQWLINRSKQVKHSIMTQMVDAGMIEEVCESWEKVIV